MHAGLFFSKFSLFLGLPSWVLGVSEKVTSSLETCSPHLTLKLVPRESSRHIRCFELIKKPELPGSALSAAWTLFPAFAQVAAMTLVY